MVKGPQSAEAILSR